MIDKAKLLKSYRTFLAGALALGLPLSVAGAQNTATPVGPAELRNFELPGTRTTPPPAEETPAPPPQAEPTPPPAERQDRPAAEPRRRATPPAERPAARTPESAPQQATPEPAPAPVAAEPPPAPTPVPVAPPPTTVSPVVAAPAEGEGGVPWLHLLLAGVAAAIALAVFRKVRSKNREVTDEAPAAPEPVPAPQPVATFEPRPRLELEFKPAKAAATDTGATVNYQISVRNMGESDARNVRIEARMFNAGKEQDQEIRAFFAAEGSGQRIAAPFTLPAQKQAKLERAVSMPRQELREILVQGRRLFIPMVAFNVLYEWGDGRTGQTSMSYIVGREAETPSDKMGAFRLDLGPRVYRSVGQRQTSLARIA